MGRALAERLGYPPDLLDALPAVSVEAFAGVSNVAIFAELPRGARVLDLGCGAGLDSLIAGQRVVDAMTFDTRLTELIALGAAVAANCAACLEHHVGKAREIGGYVSDARFTHRPDRLTEVRQAAERLADVPDELTLPAGDDRAYDADV